METLYSYQIYINIVFEKITYYYYLLYSYCIQNQCRYLNRTTATYKFYKFTIVLQKYICFYLYLRRSVVNCTFLVFILLNFFLKYLLKC